MLNGTRSEDTPVTERVEQAAGQRQPPEVGDGHVADLVGIVAGPQVATGDGAGVVLDRVGRAIGTGPVYTADEQAGCHLESGLLADLADGGGGARLARQAAAAGQRPPAALRLPAAPHEQQPAVLVKHDRPSAMYSYGHRLHPPGPLTRSPRPATVDSVTAPPSCPRCGGQLRAPSLVSRDWRCGVHGVVFPLHLMPRVTLD